MQENDAHKIVTDLSAINESTIRTLLIEASVGRAAAPKGRSEGLGCFPASKTGYFHASVNRSFRAFGAPKALLAKSPDYAVISCVTSNQKDYPDVEAAMMLMGAAYKDLQTTKALGTIICNIMSSGMRITKAICASV